MQLIGFKNLFKIFNFYFVEGKDSLDPKMDDKEYFRLKDE